ncbi:methyltransferase domain-containing protein [Nonomuraea sp. NPDC050404]|uniref:protein-L-isoaspartate O-methyltransferase family protein n=1 Tax=Nonomuraea sp. NPDC050404 TaxID=3155783 RepID=UPI0033D5EE76
MTARNTPASVADRMAALADNLREIDAIRSEVVHRAFSNVQRHLFIPGFYENDNAYIKVNGDLSDDLLNKIYSDIALMTHRPHDAAGRPSSASMPRVVGRMLEALDLRPGHRVLEIGAGTGYNAALIAAITEGPVDSVDISDVIVSEANASLQRAGVRNATAHVADGYLGHPSRGPYDRIVVTCGITGVSPGWLSQLAPNGMILAPTFHAGFHPTLAITFKERRGLVGRGVTSSDFMAAGDPLYGPRPQQAPTDPQLPAVELTTISDAVPTLVDDAYFDLWFALGVHDHRTTRAYTEDLDPALGMVCLHDPTQGTAWVQRDGHIRYTGCQDVAYELLQHVWAWDEAKRPQISDWTCQFTLSGANEPIFYPTDWRRR